MLSNLAVVLTMGLHCVAKKLLNAMALQLTINLLFISRGGIFGALHLDLVVY